MKVSGEVIRAARVSLSMWQTVEWVVPATPYWKHQPQQVGGGLDQRVLEYGPQTSSVSITYKPAHTRGWPNHKAQGHGSMVLSSGASRWFSSGLKSEDHWSRHTHQWTEPLHWKPLRERRVQKIQMGNTVSKTEMVESASHAYQDKDWLPHFQYAFQSRKWFVTDLFWIGHVHSIVSDSLWPHRLQPARLLCAWDSLGKNTGVGCHFLQGIFSTQGPNPCLLHGRQMHYHLSHHDSEERQCFLELVVFWVTFHYKELHMFQGPCWGSLRLLT